MGKVTVKGKASATLGNMCSGQARTYWIVALARHDWIGRCVIANGSNGVTVLRVAVLTAVTSMSIVALARPDWICQAVVAHGSNLVAGLLVAVLRARPPEAGHLPESVGMPVALEG